LPENVHIFKSSNIERVELPELKACVYGAAFTDSRSPALLKGFCAQRAEGITNIMCIHGEFGGRDCVYNPISEADIQQSGMDYVALGHIHKASGLRKAGNTWYSWPGCAEGRGFDETGEKTVSIVELEDGKCSLRPVCIAARKYCTIKVDVSGTDALLAVHSQLPDDTAQDIYRIILTGETESAPDLRNLYNKLSEFFFELQLRDETRLRRSVWEKAGEDTLRGLFLMKLKNRFDSTQDQSEKIRIEQAARWGLAAMDNMEEVVKHEDK